MEDDHTASHFIARYGLTYGSGDFLNTRYAAFEPRKVMIVGFNPGAGGRKKGEVQVPPVISAEDKLKLSRSEKSWRTKCANIARAWPHEIVLIELIDVPSYDVSELADIGYDWQVELKRNAPATLAKIRHHNPDIIFQTGISPHHLELTKCTFGLQHKRFLDQGVRRIAGIYELKLDGQKLPWLALRHISQNFSHTDRAAVHNYIDTHLNGAGVTRR